MDNNLNNKAKIRDPWLDNAKGILMLCVVLAHTISRVTSHEAWLMVLYRLINSVHMITFMFITGYLSQRRIKNKEYDKMITRLLIPYLILQFIYYLFYCMQSIFSGKMAEGQSLDNLVWFRPIYSLWFIFAAFVFSIIASLLPYDKHPFLVLAITFLISWCGIFAPPNINYFKFTKAIGFFPFFIAGFLFDKEKMQTLRNKKIYRFPSALYVAAWIVAFIVFRDFFKNFTFIMRQNIKSYPSELHNIKGILLRPAYLVLGAVFILAFLTLIPRGKTIFTKLGQRSMYIYALQGIIILTFRMVDSYIFKINKHINSPAEYAVLIASAVILTFILGSGFVERLFKPILEPNINLSRFFGKQEKS